MATNIVHEHGDQLVRKITVPASGAKSGDPVLCGTRPGVALTDQDANGFATVKFNGSADLLVKGETTTNAAIAEGDVLYYDPAATPHKINKDSANGVRYGYAAAAVASGATKTITVDIGH
ncbi:capsid cement protein [Spirillospora sp. CA-294931]|uniref:capsid cement protein n=1 Tax=Spirillospora sp. CA-294931 TaxID=3240042 RepID=UPI003D92F4CF